MFGRWGWYLIVDALADGGRFTLPGYSPQDSAQRSNFFEAMIWYAKEKDQAEQQAALASQT